MTFPGLSLPTIAPAPVVTPKVAALPGTPKISAPVVTKKKVKSGHCNLGHCEGTSPVSPSGASFRTCEALDWCACKCHVEWDEMFKASGRERILITNPKYAPLERTWWMPSLEDRAEEIAAIATVKFEGDKPPEFVVHDSGRTARGQLEYWVKQVTDAWDKSEECTPKYIAAQIAASQDVVPPSVGAIHSVLMRWEKMEYAMVARNPVRFIGLDVPGMRYGLDNIKAQYALKEAKP